MDTSVNDLILLASPLHLAQCMGLEMVEISLSDASSMEDVSLSWSAGLTLAEPYLGEAPFEEFSDNVEMGNAILSMGLIDSIYTKPLASMPISSPFLPITPSRFHACHESLCGIRGSHPLFDLYRAYLGDVPKKITWSTFFDPAFDFSMAFDEFKRPLTLFVPSLLVFSYLHHSKMHAMTYDKLLRALAAYKLMTHVLRDKEWLILLTPLWHTLDTFSAQPSILVLSLLLSFYFFLFLFV